MPVSLEDYEGLEILNATPSGAGGAAIQENFKKLVDWQVRSVLSVQSDPGSISNPVKYNRYLIGEDPQGVWAGKTNQIAEFQDPGWTYDTAQQAVYDVGASRLYLRTNAGTIQADAGGGSRGANSVDLQYSRSSDSEVASGIGATISGGGFNTASSLASTVGGGVGNTSSGSYGGVFSGDGSTADGSNAAVGGGSSNSAYGDWSTIAGGSSNAAYGDSASIIGGSSNSASGDYASVLGGLHAVADKYGQVAHASGRFGSVSGSAQASTLVARYESSSSGSVSLFLDASSARMTIAQDTAWAYEVSIICIKSDASIGKAFFHRGVIINNGGTVSVSDDPNPGSEYAPGSTDPGWITSVGVSNSALDVTGNSNGDSVRWVARVHLTEVTY